MGPAGRSVARVATGVGWADLRSLVAGLYNPARTPEIMMNRLSLMTRWIASLVLVLAAAVPSLAGEDYERWYAVELGKNRVGWMHVQQKSVDELITTSSRMEFSVARDQAGAKISMSGTFVETKDGKPVSMSSVIKFGRQPTTMQATFGESEIDVTVAASGRTERKKRPLPEGTWLTPAAATEYVKQRMAAGAETITVRMMEPLSGGMDPMASLKVSTVERTDKKPAQFEFGGKSVAATRWTTTSSAAPSIKSTEVVDADGLPLSTEANMGMMVMTMRAVDEAEAKAEHKAPELMVNTFVKPDRAIAKPRTTKRAVYVLSIPEGDMPTVPTTGSQQVTVIDARSIRVTIDTKALSAAPEADVNNTLFTACPTNLNCNDPEVKHLASEAVAKAGESAAAKAEAIRAFVYKHIHRKDLDVGFATASEVARTQQGDCTEHGVLTAAMLRVHGIPSRVVAGVVYADFFAGGKDIFAYHMWSQALLEVDGKPTWVDLDATLPAATPYDATHIALAVASLGEEDTQESLATIAMLLGRLKVTVESVE